MIGTARRPAPSTTDSRAKLPTAGVASVQVVPRFLRVGGYAATLVVTGYPAEVRPAWLEPLLSWPGRLDVAVHIDPLPAAVAAARLRTPRARYESSRRSDEARGKLADRSWRPRRIRSEPQLVAACQQVKAAAASTLLEVRPATWRHLAGWTTTLPYPPSTVAVARLVRHGRR